MSTTIPAEILIDKLVIDSQKTLTNLRDKFVYEKAIPVPSAVPLQQQDEIDMVPLNKKPNEILREYLNKYSAFDECIFSAASRYSAYFKFQLDLLIDIPDLMAFDQVWAAQVMHGHSFNSINVICYDILKEKIQDESVLLPEYFFLNLGLKRIPTCFYLDFKSVFQKRSYLQIQKQPVIVMGIISKEYEAMLELSTFTCVHEKCRNKDILTVQRRSNGIKVVKRSEDQALLYYEYRYTLKLLNIRKLLLETDTQCTHCGEKMRESMVDRVCNQYKKVKIDAFDQDGVFSNSLTIKLSNNMINLAHCGDQIEVIGFVLQENDTGNYSKKAHRNSVPNIVASSVQKIHQVNGVFDLLKNSDFFGLSNATLPHHFKEIIESERSPYSTGQSIVDMFMSDWIPSRMFRKMKLSLLMSLVSNSPNEQKGMNVNIMIVTDALNPLIIRILHRAGSFKRFVKGDFTSDRIPITDGIVLMEIQNLKDLRKMVNALRESKNSKAACIWGLSYSKDILTKKEFKESIGSFDVVLNLCNSAYFSLDEVLADCVINESLDKVQANPRWTDLFQFQKYLYIASKISVSVTSEAEEILELYLAALRNRDIESFNNYDISFKKLICIAGAHAKLCLRNKILVDDSIVSIILAEETLAFLSGESLMSFRSLPQDRENLFVLFQASDDGASDDSLSDPFMEDAFIRFYEDLQKFF